MKFSIRIISLVITLVMMICLFSVPAFAAETDVMYGIGFVNASALRLRSEPDTSSSILDTAPRNDCVVVISKDGAWYKVNYNLQIGYMHEDYVDVLTRENAELGYGKVIGTSVNLRSGPSTSYNVVAMASRNDKAYILGLNNGWYKVLYGSRICYIRSDYMELTEIPYENKDSSNSPRFFRHGKSTGVAPSASALNGNQASAGSAPNSGSVGDSSSSVAANGSQIVSEAKKYLGYRYVYGGASPSTGFDCSGFVYYVLKQCGYSPYRTPADQYSHGTYVSKADLQPGDIVFFAGTGSSNTISHVGIYVGGGQIIHSPNSRSTVSYADITSGYWANHYYGARRMG